MGSGEEEEAGKHSVRRKAFRRAVAARVTAEPSMRCMMVIWCVSTVRCMARKVS